MNRRSKKKKRRRRRSKNLTGNIFISV